MSNTRESAVRCRAVRKDGTPCKGRPIADGLCFAHQPQAHEWQAAGGRAKRNSERAAKMLPTSMQPVAQILSVALQQVYDGSLEPRVGSAMATIAGALCKVYQLSEFEERLRVVESTLAGHYELEAGPA